MNLKNYLPITQMRLDILSELYQNNLNLIEIEKRILKSKQLTFQTLKAMSMVEKDINGTYFIKTDFLNIFENLIRYNLLVRRMSKYFDMLSYLYKNV